MNKSIKSFFTGAIRIVIVAKDNNILFGAINDADIKI